MKELFVVFLGAVLCISGLVYFVKWLIDDESWFWEIVDPDPPGCDRGGTFDD